MCEVKGYYHLYLEKYSCEHKGCENTLQKKVKIRFIFQTLSSISPNFHVVCLQPNAWLESYGRYGSFGTLIWGSLIVSPVLWLLSSRNTLSATHSDTASYTDPSLRGEVYSNINSGVLEWNCTRCNLQTSSLEPSLRVSSWHLDEYYIWVHKQ